MMDNEVFHTFYPFGKTQCVAGHPSSNCNVARNIDLSEIEMKLKGKVKSYLIWMFETLPNSKIYT